MQVCMSQFVYVVVGATAILVAGGLLAGFVPQAGTGTAGPGESVFFENIGTVGALQDVDPSSRDVHLGSFTVEETSPNRTAYQNQEIQIHNTVRSEEAATLTFDAFRPQKAYLRFISTRATDPADLVMMVNGQEVPVRAFTHDTRTTIPIDAEHLQQGENVVRLSARDPGWAFWQRPSFVFEDVQIVLDDLENRQVIRPFEAFDYESNGFAYGEVTFTVQDEAIRDQPLDITLNGNPVASRLPVKRATPYNIRFFANTTGLRHGENVLAFRTYGDSFYPLSNVRVSLVYYAQTQEHTVVRDIPISEAQYNALGRNSREGQVRFDVDRIFVERPLTLSFGDMQDEFVPRPGGNVRRFDQEHVQPGENELRITTDGAYRIENLNVSFAETG